MLPRFLEQVALRLVPLCDEEVARQGRTMSELVESALRLLFQMRQQRPELPSLPSFSSGGAWVDVADRQAPYEAMEGR